MLRLTDEVGSLRVGAGHGDACRTEWSPEAISS
jgi:hypothetical protein